MSRDPEIIVTEITEPSEAPEQEEPKVFQRGLVQSSDLSEANNALLPYENRYAAHARRQRKRGK